MADNIDELHRKIKDLEGEVAYLNAQLKQDNRFGLHWIDVPEAFEAGGENAIPILEEVSDLSITTDDGKPTHILIEGDNYHALTCLNYTHQGKVDVIYIDPPYNTGSDGFTYKDKRFLDKYPDGTQLPKNHPLRHSSWLSFMDKRMRVCHKSMAHPFRFSSFSRYRTEKIVFIYNKAQTFTSSGFAFPQKICIFAENFFKYGKDTNKI